MLPESTFQQIQQQFAANIRDPEHNPIPEGVEVRRMAVYQELFFNNIQGVLESGFPVLHSLYPEEEWQRLVRDFFHHHPCSSPFFIEIPQAFVEYLFSDYRGVPTDPPFLQELAHYEWIELDLSIAEEEPVWDDSSQAQDPLQSIPICSPLVRVLHYHYPVQTISIDNQPQQPTAEPQPLLLYRDQSHEIHFMATTSLVTRLLELMQQQQGGSVSGQQLLQKLAEEASQPVTEQWLQQGAALLNTLQERGIVHTLPLAGGGQGWG